MTTVEDDVSVGAVLFEATRQYFRSFPRFALVATLAHLPVMIVDAVSALFPQDVGAAAVLTPASGLLGTVALAVTSAYVVPPVMSGIGHRQAPAFAQFSSRVGGALVTAWISNFIIGLGLLCFVVPGIVLSVWYCLAIAASVAEGIGAGRAMERSKALTEGHRGTAVLLALTYGTLLVGTLLVAAVPQFLLTFEQLGGESVGPASLVAAAVLPVLVQALVVAFGAAIYTVFYVRLRELKDGIDAASIAAVFR